MEYHTNGWIYNPLIFIYFFRHRAAMDSEDEEGASPAPPILLRALSTDNETGSSDAEPLSLSEGSLESPTPTTPRRQEKSKDREDDRTSMVKCIVNSVVESEAVYVECLNVMLQVSNQCLFKKFKRC